MLFQEELKELLNYYEGIEKSISNILESSPNGGLIYQSNHGHDQFLHYYKDNDRKCRKVITQDVELISALAKKQFAKESLKILEPDVELLKNAINQMIPYDPDNILKSMDKAYAHLPEDYFFDRNKVNISMHLDDESKSRIERHREWGRQPYNQSLYLPEYKKTRTSKGLMVRSKSEALICETLYRICDIPHRYEQEKVIDGYIYIPDFTFEAFDFS